MLEDHVFRKRFIVLSGKKLKNFFIFHMIFSSIEDDLTLIPAFSTWLSRQTKTMVCSPWFQPFPHDFLFNGRRSHLKSGLFHIILSSKEDDLTLIPAFSTWFSLQWKTISPWFQYFPHDYLVKRKRWFAHLDSGIFHIEWLEGELEVSVLLLQVGSAESNLGGGGLSNSGWSG